MKVMGFRSTCINIGKLIVKCGIITAPLWGFPIYCANNMIRYVGSDYVGPLWIDQFTKTNHQKHYSTLIIGDSTANSAYLPEVLSDSAVNLSLAGSSPMDGYYTLENYLLYNDAPDDIFVSYMDYHLAEDFLVWEPSNYIHKFSREQNEEIYRTIDKVSDCTPEELTIDDFHNQLKYYEYYSPTIYSYSVGQAIGGARAEANKVAYEDLEVRKGRYSMITNREYEPEGIMGYSTFAVSPLQEEYYIKILDLCEENDINVHMVKLPLSTDAGFIDDYEEEVADYYDDLLEDYDDADFYWFHTTYEHEFFCDEYHMNNHGAFRFSRELREQYPDIFDEGDEPVITSARMLGLDADIAGENYMGELVKWIDNKPYTLIILDSTGNLGEYYNVSIGYNNREVQWLDVDDNDEYALYYLSADGEPMQEDIKVSCSNKSVSVSVGDDVTYLTPADGPGMRFCVVDNYNNKIVCTRQCIYGEKGFRDIL